MSGHGSVTYSCHQDAIIVHSKLAHDPKLREYPQDDANLGQDTGDNSVDLEFVLLTWYGDAAGEILDPHQR